MAKKFKTNALRMLDKAKIPYSIKEYEYDEEHLDGRHVASQVDMVPEAIFKIQAKEVRTAKDLNFVSFIT